MPVAAMESMIKIDSRVHTPQAEYSGSAPDCSYDLSQRLGWLRHSDCGVTAQKDNSAGRRTIARRATYRRRGGRSHRVMAARGQGNKGNCGSGQRLLERGDPLLDLDEFMFNDRARKNIGALPLPQPNIAGSGPWAGHEWRGPLQVGQISR